MSFMNSFLDPLDDHQFQPGPQELACDLYFSRNKSCCYPFAVFYLRWGSCGTEASWTLRGHPGFLVHAEIMDYFTDLWRAKDPQVVVELYECGWVELTDAPDNRTQILLCCDSAVHAQSRSHACLVQQLARSGHYDGSVQIRCNNMHHNRAATAQDPPDNSTSVSEDGVVCRLEADDEDF